MLMPKTAPKPAEWMVKAARALQAALGDLEHELGIRALYLPEAEVAAIIAQHAPQPKPGWEREAAQDLHGYDWDQGSREQVAEDVARIISEHAPGPALFALGYMNKTNKPEMFPDLLDKDSFARGLGITTRTADRWARLRIGPPRIKAGKRILYRQSAVEAWLREREAGRFPCMGPRSEP